MSSWKWFVAGLVALLLAFGGGALLGHRLSTSGDAERAAWEARADSMLGAEKKRHRATVAAILDSVAGDTTEVHRLRRIAAAAHQEGRVWQAEADTLKAMLVVASTAQDTLRLYRGAVTLLDSALSRETARGDALEAALDTAMVATARLLRLHSVDSTRIVSLEHQLEVRPKSDRWRFRVLGMDFRPCGFAGVDAIDRGAAVGVGVCATP